MLRTDVVVAEVSHLLHRVFDNLLAQGGFVALARPNHVRPAPDELLDFQPDSPSIYVQILQDVGRHPAAFLDQSQENVLGADIFVIKVVPSWLASCMTFRARSVKRSYMAACGLSPTPESRPGMACAAGEISLPEHPHAGQVAAAQSGSVSASSIAARLYLENGLDLHCHPQRQRADADGAAGAHAGVAAETSASNSLQPLITAGCWVNSGVQLTAPRILSTRPTRSRLPSSFRSVARMLSPANWAAR